MIQVKQMQAILDQLVATAQEKYVTPELALRKDLAGMRMYENPLIGVADAADPIFEQFKADPAVIGSHYMLPEAWLPGAKSIISVFVPFTDAVKKANAAVKPDPSAEWLHARIEGQEFIKELTVALIDYIKEAGAEAMAPSIDPRFQSYHDDEGKPLYTSNWSERHTAYACGLGTFGLSKGLITEKGIAGRFFSVITTAVLTPHERPYSGVYDYCTLCGKCVKNCPVDAITIEKGKSHPICDGFLGEMRAKYKPRYGCGKCQVRVPCESRIPLKKA